MAISSGHVVASTDISDSSAHGSALPGNEVAPPNFFRANHFDDFFRDIHLNNFFRAIQSESLVQMRYRLADSELFATVAFKETDAIRRRFSRTPTNRGLFDNRMLEEYILLCCQDEAGGFRDKPDKARYHTCYVLGIQFAE
ncbi:hypothetical protein COOONC_19006 [Cooperia oncophora]